jgi:hypothetical protein
MEIMDNYLVTKDTQTHQSSQMKTNVQTTNNTHKSTENRQEHQDSHIAEHLIGPNPSKYVNEY